MFYLMTLRSLIIWTTISHFVRSNWSIYNSQQNDNLDCGLSDDLHGVLLSNECKIQKSFYSNELDSHFLVHDNSNNFDEDMYFEISYELKFLANSLTSNITGELSAGLSDIWDQNLNLNSKFLSWTVQKSVFRWTPSHQLSENERNRRNNSLDLYFHMLCSKPEKETLNSCSVHLRDFNLRLLKQPKKVPLEGRRQSVRVMSDASADPCRLLGSSHAVIMHSLTVRNESLSLQDVEGNQQYTTDWKGSDVGDVASVKTRDRLFCGLYTMESKHNTSVQTIKDTWGRDCDGFLAFSTADDASLPAVSLPHSYEESYSNMWQKVRSIWLYIQKHYSTEYDWFLLGGDDMYYIIPNLLHFLHLESVQSTKQQGQGVFLGRRFRYTNQKTGDSLLFNTGGAGYLLDRVALQRLVKHLDEYFCNPHMRSSFEDVCVALCLWNLQLLPPQPPVSPLDTKDQFGRHRFHHFPPGFLFIRNLEEPYRKKLKEFIAADSDFFTTGFDCCSEESVSFHYISPDLMRDLNDFVFFCPREERERYFSLYGKNYFDPKTVLWF